MNIRFLVGVSGMVLLVSLPAVAADNLQLNNHLDYQSDSADGPLITGDNMSAGIVAGEPNYIIIYAEECFNSKRQARRTVELYSKYKSRMNFVVVDLDQPRSAAQEDLIGKYYQGSIPQVTVLDRAGHAVYDRAGEVETQFVTTVLDKTLR